MPCDNKILQNFAIKISSESGRIPEDLLSLASNTSSEANPNVMNSVSESSDTTEAHQVKNHVKEIGNGNNEDVESITLEASQWEQQYLKNVAKFIYENKGESLSSSSVIALIKKQFEMNLHTMETFIECLKSRAGEDVKIQEDLKAWEMVHCEVKARGTEENLQTVLKKLLEKGMLDLGGDTQDAQKTNKGKEKNKGEKN